MATTSFKRKCNCHASFLLKRIRLIFHATSVLSAESSCILKFCSIFGNWMTTWTVFPFFCLLKIGKKEVAYLVTQLT